MPFSLGEFEITWTFEVASVFLMIPHQFFVLNSNLNDATLSSLGNLRYFDVYTPTPKKQMKERGTLIIPSAIYPYACLI